MRQRDTRSLPVERLGISVRTLNALYAADLLRIGEVAELTPKQVRALKGVGGTSAVEIQCALERLGVFPGAASEPEKPDPLNRIAAALERIAVALEAGA